MDVKQFYECLKDNGTNCFCGVPDSLLKYFCAYLTDNCTNHTITANEGNAIALAAGHYLSTGNIACVYMQNSGIGNCVNPLLSLTDDEVYNIPVLMLIGWRGMPGVKDEPQHIKQGKVTEGLLEAMNIKYSVLSNDNVKVSIKEAFDYMKKTRKPYAFLIPKDTFDKYTLVNKKSDCSDLKRELAIEKVLQYTTKSDIIVSTTGHISRELYELRNKYSQLHNQDFLTVGSMGHASSIALGIALNKTDRNVFCFDGDGAFLMHMGAAPIIASKKLKNFKHIIFNNEAHDSVGAQPTVSSEIDFAKLAISCGYNKVYQANSLKELDSFMDEFVNSSGTILLEVKVACGARSDLGRPKESPCENKKIFMENICGGFYRS